MVLNNLNHDNNLHTSVCSHLQMNINEKYSARATYSTFSKDTSDVYNNDYIYVDLIYVEFIYTKEYALLIIERFKATFPDFY